jgi:hypothetical protein
MAFIRIEGLCGKVFIPDVSSETKKHPCSDCFECARCGDDRCRICRDGSGPDEDKEQ